MSDNKHKPVGENALQRVVRLLRKANDEMVDVGTDEQIYMVMRPDGSGVLLLTENSQPDHDLWGFDSPEHLVKFLEARPMKRLLMVQAWCR